MRRYFSAVGVWNFLGIWDFGFRPPANEFAPAQSKSPWMMGRASDSDSRIGDDVDARISSFDEAMTRICAQVDFVMAIRNRERLGQLARS